MLNAPSSRPDSARPESLEELVRTINVNGDFLHADHAPSVDKLIELGDPAIPRMLDLMLLNGEYDGFTRLHAETVLYGIVAGNYGFVSGRGYSDPNGNDRANALWKSLGSLNWKAPLEERERAVRLWRERYAKDCPLPAE
jgi:hypothetical protein